MNHHAIRQLVKQARAALGKSSAEFVEIAIPDLIGLEAVRAGQPIPPLPDERQMINLPRPRTVNVPRKTLWALVDAAEAVRGVLERMVDLTPPIDDEEE